MIGIKKMYENVQRGEYQVGDKVLYFRSLWEANYALYLEFLKKNGEIKDWQYEPYYFEFTQIRHGTTRYLPDFLVINNNGSQEVHEVKGYMDSRSKTKLKRMAKYYPKIKVVMVDAAFMKDLKKRWGKLLKFY